VQASDNTPRARARLYAASALVRAGRLAEGIAALSALDADAEAVAGFGDAERAQMLATTIDCRLARGDLAEAMALGDGLVPYLEMEGLAGAFAHHAKGELASALGDPELAVQHFEAAGQCLVDHQTGAHPITLEALPWRASAALAMVRVGRRREAVALAVAHHADASRGGSAYARAQALRTLATADAGDQRVHLLREARAALRGGSADRLSAQIDTDLAGLLLLENSGPANLEALALLRNAEEYAGHQELWPLQGRVRRLLDRLGEAPQRVQSEALATLTSSERRVANLASLGLTNRQIAAELVVSVKAVEWHLSHTYRKLGINSRTRLAALLGASV